MGISNKKRLAILASGGGSNLGAIIEAINSGIINNAEISLVISNKADAFALSRAENAGIPAFCLKNDEQILDKLKEFNIDLVLLAGYLKILTKPFLDKYNGRILNIHPSFLPDFGGKGMYGIKVHQEVIKSGVLFSGCSVHIVTEEIDGGPILAQTKVPVMQDDTPEILAKRVLEQEHLLYPIAVQKYIENLLVTK